MRGSKLVVIVVLGVLSGIGMRDGRCAESFADQSGKIESSTRELFQTAGHLYRFERPVKLSSGAYHCLAEELGYIDRPDATEDPALYLLQAQPTWYGSQEDRPETKQVLALLDDHSPEVRLAAAIWLFNDSDLWWIERLDPPLRDKLQGRLLGTFRKQLHHESQSLRCEAAQTLAELKMDRALAVLIETLQDEQYAHANDIAYGVRAAFEWRTLSGGRLCLPNGEDLPLSSDWSRDTMLSVLEQLVERPGGKKPHSVLSKHEVISLGPDLIEWKELSKEEKDLRFRECVEKLRSIEARDRMVAAYSLGHLKDPHAVELLLFALQDDEAQVRAQAARSLGEIGDRRSVAALQLLMKDLDAQVRRAAVSALATLDDSDAIRHLITALQDDDEQVRMSAVGDLADAGGTAAADALAKVLTQDRNEEVRRAAIDALAKRKDRRAFDAILAALDDDDRWVRAGAVDALGELGDVRALRPLLIAASGTGPTAGLYRGSALAAIGQLPKEQMRQQLLDELTQENFATQSGAALALGLVGDAYAVVPLLDALKKNDPFLRQSVIWALMRLGDDRAVDPLIAELKREFSWSRVDAAIALGHLNDRRAVRPLCDALSDRDALVRLATAVALGMLADKEAVEPLVTVLADEDIRVATAAAEALAFIGDSRAKEPLAERLFQAPLFALGWKPNTLEDCVRLFWLAGKRSMMAALAAEATPVLLRCLASDDTATRDYSASVLIRIGDEKTLPALIAMLEKHGTDEIALVYNSCGKQELIAAARSWAKRHTGTIGSQSPSIQWGGSSPLRRPTDYSSYGGYGGVSWSYGPVEDSTAPTTTLDRR